MHTYTHAHTHTHTQLQLAISDKDSAIAALEHKLQETTPPTSRKNSGIDEVRVQTLASLTKLRRQRSSLMSQLKVKVSGDTF